jgi:hypothetical protein
LGFELEGMFWPSAEHYFQAMKFQDEALQAAIRAAATPKQAQQMGRKFWLRRKIRKDWAALKVTVMTRALYTRCKTHADAAAAVLATGERQLVEDNAYNYFWGCGRDRRGENQYGKIIMRLRSKLLLEQSES